MKTILNLINGRHAAGSDGAQLDVFEPATGGLLAHAPASTAADVRAAVSAARAAFPAWAATPAAERSRLLLRLADLVEANLEELAEAESRDTGKPIALARGLDIPRSAVNLRFFATAILHAAGESYDFDGGGVPGGAAVLNYTLRKPRGVAACISPWNLPLYLFTWKIAPALATGNTVVGKPSEVTPVTAAMLAELSVEAGLPAGVLNIVHGTGAQAGAALVEHPDVPTVTFTGSTGVGRWIGETCGRMLKRCSLELGGKNAFIVFGDADVEEAATQATRAAFSNQGQICLCGSRLLVHESVYEAVVAGVVARARALRIGDPMEEGTQFGALTSRTHFEKVAGMVELARSLGGEVRTGGTPAPREELPDRCRGGWFYAPTVITGLDPSCKVEQEEIFGPVVTVQKFRDEEEAVRLANGTSYGLAASVFTRDVGRAHRVAARLEAGIVWVNCWMVRDLRTPFGGVKQSGVGREGGWEALKFFTEVKNVGVRL